MTLSVPATKEATSTPAPCIPRGGQRPPTGLPREVSMDEKSNAVEVDPCTGGLELAKSPPVESLGARETTPDCVLIRRALTAWKARSTRAGTAHTPPSSVREETHKDRSYVVLRRDDQVLAEYEVRRGCLRHVASGPAREEHEAQLREERERRELESLEKGHNDVLIARALDCMHALNRYAKQIRSKANLERWEGQTFWLHGRFGPAASDYRFSSLQSKIYALKDRLLTALVLTDRASVGVFEHTRTTREHYCPDCGRSWVGDSQCYECRIASGVPTRETTRFYLVDCGHGYRFHQPGVCEQVARRVLPIEPHDPTQPVREVPDVGLSVEGQIRCVQLAVERLESELPPAQKAELMQAAASATPSAAAGSGDPGTLLPHDLGREPTRCHKRQRSNRRCRMPLGHDGPCDFETQEESNLRLGHGADVYLHSGAQDAAATLASTTPSTSSGSADRKS